MQPHVPSGLSALGLLFAFGAAVAQELVWTRPLENLAATFALSPLDVDDHFQWIGQVVAGQDFAVFIFFAALGAHDLYPFEKIE